jgi:glycosyltransferase involved in cell wall biosynthesis
LAESAITVSVIIPVYNRSSIVQRAIESALAQQLSAADGIEIVVVDDGSSDAPAAALEPYGPRVRLVRHEVNRGAAAARNTGIANAVGEYIAFLDSDDIWLTGKLEIQLGLMKSKGWRASCTSYQLSKAGRSFVSPHYLVWGCFVSPGSTLICERTIFQEIGDFDTSFGRLEDWDWLLCYTRKLNLGFVAQSLALVDPSVGVDQTKVIRALEFLRQKHIPHLSTSQRRHFAAALNVERAAAAYRSGSKFLALRFVLQSLLSSPGRNDSLRAVLHNHRSRPEVGVVG